jgi:hypothetical protein
MHFLIRWDRLIEPLASNDAPLGRRAENTNEPSIEIAGQGSFVYLNLRLVVSTIIGSIVKLKPRAESPAVRRLGNGVGDITRWQQPLLRSLLPFIRELHIPFVLISCHRGFSTAAKAEIPNHTRFISPGTNSSCPPLTQCVASPSIAGSGVKAKSVDQLQLQLQGPARSHINPSTPWPITPRRAPHPLIFGEH